MNNELMREKDTLPPKCPECGADNPWTYGPILWAISLYGWICGHCNTVLEVYQETVRLGWRKFAEVPSTQGVIKLWAIACPQCSQFYPYPGPGLVTEIPKVIMWCPTCKCELRRVYIEAKEG